MPNNRRLLYNPFSNVVTAFIIFIVIIVFILLFIGLVGAAFGRIGFSTQQVIALLLVTLLGSFVNIPVTTVESHKPIMTNAYVQVYGVTYRIPAVREKSTKTVIAVNLGGAVIPSIVSLYLLLRFPNVVPFAIVGIVIVSIISHLTSKPVEGVGIVSPAFVTPIIAAVYAIVISTQFLSTSEIFALAYVCGVLGTLIGADLTNIDEIKKIGAPVASIGGAGTFDGVFLAGIIAVLLA